MPSASEALVTAIKSGDFNSVKDLLGEQPGLIDHVTDNGIPITLLAAYYRQAPIFEWLMSRRDAPNIYEAAAADNTSRVAALLDTAPKLLDAHAPDGFTALALAAYFGKFTVADLLVKRGADVNLAANNGTDIAPLHAAVAANSNEITRLLLEHGANVDLRQNGGVTALHSAAHRGNIAIVKLLLEKDASATVQTNDGKTPLDFAKADGHDEVVALLQGK